MYGARQFSKSLHVPEWPSPPPTATISEQKASLKHYRHEVVMPAVLRTVNRIPPNPALPWAWIAINFDQSFASKGFEAWWQWRILGQNFPPTQCRWSSSATSMIASHHRISCDHFATMSWTNGIRPEKICDYPPDPNWFTVVLRLIGDALRNWRAGRDDATLAHHTTCSTKWHRAAPLRDARVGCAAATSSRCCIS